MVFRGTQFDRALYLFRHARLFRVCDSYSWSHPQVSEAPMTLSPYKLSHQSVKRESGRAGVQNFCLQPIDELPWVAPHKLITKFAFYGTQKLITDFTRTQILPSAKPILYY